MKKSIGLYLTALSAIAAVVGVIAYIINCNTDYFVNLGIDPAIVACAIIAVVVEAAYIVVTKNGHQMWSDILPVAAAVLLMVATLLFISVRVNGIAAIMTYEGNAKTMADLTSAIIGIAGCLIATVAGIVASFFDTVKE